MGTLSVSCAMRIVTLSRALSKSSTQASRPGGHARCSAPCRRREVRDRRQQVSSPPSSARPCAARSWIYNRLSPCRAPIRGGPKRRGRAARLAEQLIAHALYRHEITRLVWVLLDLLAQPRDGGVQFSLLTLVAGVV